MQHAPGAGDVDHLYGRYYDCVADTCSVGVAASADRSRIWRKSPMSVPVDPYAVLYPVGPRTLVAAVQVSGPPTIDSQQWLASVDAGAAWRRVTVAPAEAIPAGWRALITGREVDDLLAVNPATGNTVRVRASHGLQMAQWVNGAPAGADIWVSSGFGACHASVAAPGTTMKVAAGGGALYRGIRGRPCLT